MTTEKNFYKSNLKIMKVKNNELKKEKKYEEAEEVLNKLLDNLDTLYKDVIKAYVEFGRYDVGTNDIPTSKYIEHKERLLKAIAKAETSEMILKDKLLKQLHYLDDNFNLDDTIARSIKNDSIADRKDLIEYINSCIDGVTAEDDILSEFITVKNPNGVLLL